MISLHSSINLSPVDDLHEDLYQRGILVVDDSSMHRYSAHLCLRAFGIDNIVEVPNGKLALDHLTRQVPPPAVMMLVSPGLLTKAMLLLLAQ